MTVSEILSCDQHRPWPMPNKKWKYYQEWNNAVFLHWKVEYSLLRDAVPSSLDIDLLDGEAWVSAVAFTMESVTIRGIPPISPIANFHELNLRTYVRFRDKPGVYFLSIEAGNRLSTWLAKTFSRLPYTYAAVNRNDNAFECIHDGRRSRFTCTTCIGEKIMQTSLIDQWFVERYGLFQDNGQRINTFDVHHVPWPLHTLEIKSLEMHYPKFGDLLQGMPDKMHYSPGVQVMCWD